MIEPRERPVGNSIVHRLLPWRNRRMVGPFIFAIGGALTVAGQTLPTGHLAVLEPGARPALAGHGHAMVLGGDPVGHRHIWWNFVHSDRERIEEAKQRWADQEFPKVPGDHDPWVPLPR